MVHRIAINMSKRCWECGTELDDKTVSTKPKYCGEECRKTSEARMMARRWEQGMRRSQKGL